MRGVEQVLLRVRLERQAELAAFDAGSAREQVRTQEQPEGPALLLRRDGTGDVDGLPRRRTRRARSIWVTPAISNDQARDD